jgi:hypothetical protein
LGNSCGWRLAQATNVYEQVELLSTMARRWGTAINSIGHLARSCGTPSRILLEEAYAEAGRRRLVEQWHAPDISAVRQG